jgi:hypothetical protein
MAGFNKFRSFVEAVGRKVHNLNADVLKVLLTNTVPVNTNAVKADLTEIAAGSGYAAGGTASAGNAYSQTAGVGKLTSGDVVFTAAGGTIGPFRYAVLYNDTATNDELIGWWDYGSSITLNDTETFTVDFDGTNGILTLT